MSSFASYHLVKNVRHTPSRIVFGLIRCASSDQRQQRPVVRPETLRDPSDSEGGSVKVGKNWKFHLDSLTFSNLRPDKVPDNYAMVYRSRLETFANFGLAGAGVFTLLYVPTLAFQLYGGEGTLQIHETAMFGVAGCFIITALYFLCLKVALRIYYSAENDQFLVFTPTVIPFKTNKLVLRPGQLAPPKRVSSYLPWVALQHTDRQSGRKLLVNYETFTLPMYYNRLAGFR